jgi:hypothetical protein
MEVGERSDIFSDAHPADDILAHGGLPSPSRHALIRVELRRQLVVGFSGRENVSTSSVVACSNVRLIVPGSVTLPLVRNTLTFPNGHTIDAMRSVAGDVRRLSATIATQAKQSRDTGTNDWVDVTAPGNVLLNGELIGGAVRWQRLSYGIYGRSGTLIASGEGSPQLSPVALHGARGSDRLRALPVPDQHHSGENAGRRAPECGASFTRSSPQHCAAEQHSSRRLKRHFSCIIGSM